MRSLVVAAVALSFAACANQAGDPPADSSASAAGAQTAAASAPATESVAAAPTEVKGAEMDTFAMPANLETTASGLQYSVDQPGTGAAPKAGQIVRVHYTGWLTNGTKFDSSRDRNEPLEFPLGRGRVIKGWDEGVAAMTIGEKRTLVIPPGLGYGAAGAGGVIPPNATLVFKVELVGVK